MTPDHHSYVHRVNMRRPHTRSSTRNVSQTSRTHLGPKSTPICGAHCRFRQSEVGSTTLRSWTIIHATRRLLYSRPKIKLFKHTKVSPIGHKRNMAYASRGSGWTAEGSTLEANSQNSYRTRVPSNGLQHTTRLSIMASPNHSTGASS